MNKYLQPLKILSIAVAVVGYFVAKELESREIEEKVEKVIERRESVKKMLSE